MSLRASDLSVRFGGVVALDAVSMAVEQGEVVGLVGPNGSGKSTLLNAVSGMVSASGSLEVDGQPVPLGAPRRVRRAGVLRTFQTPQVYGELSCIDNAVLSSPDDADTGLFGSWVRRPSMLRHERERWAAGAAALGRVGLADLAQVSTSELSYGQQRMVEIARVMVARPRLIMLDEPAAGLNSSETEQLASLLIELHADGISLLVVDHKVDFLDRLCDRLVVLQLGRIIAEGTPAQVWSDQAVVDAYLGGGR